MSFSARTIEPRYADRSLAKKQADKLTSDYRSAPIPVYEIAEANGVDVVLDDFGRYGDEIAGMCDFNGKILYVNSQDPLPRQMFTIAHELGHWILHKDFFEKNPALYPVLPRKQSVATSNVFEQEANHFAAHLLVPDKLLLPVRGLTSSSLARMFRVSVLMMETRLKNVGR